VEDLYSELDNTNTTLQTTTEKIKTPNINSFIKTSLVKKGFNLDNSFKIFYSYLNLSNEYFISFYKNRGKVLFDFEYFKYLFENEKESNFLILYKNYLFLYKNKEFYYYQKIDRELSLSDLEEYINKRFNFYIDKTYNLSKKDIDELKENIKKPKSSLSYIKSYRSLNLFYSYLIIIVLLPFAYTFYMNNENKIYLDSKIKTVNKELEKKGIEEKELKLFTKIKKLFDELEKKEIELIKIDYKNNSVSLFMKSTNRDNFYAFFKRYKNIKIDSIEHKSQDDSYETSASFLL